MWARLSRGGGWEKGRERGAIDCPPVPIAQLAERGRIALPGSLDEVVIGHTDSRQRGGFAGWVDAGCWLLVAGVVCWRLVGWDLGPRAAALSQRRSLNPFAETMDTASP